MINNLLKIDTKIFIQIFITTATIIYLPTIFYYGSPDDILLETSLPDYSWSDII